MRMFHVANIVKCNFYELVFKKLALANIHSANILWLCRGNHVVYDKVMYS